MHEKRVHLRLAVQMTPIFNQVITDCAAWESARIGGREGLLRHLTRAEVAAIEALAAPLDPQPVHQITRLQFTDPLVDALMAEARQQVMRGRGAIILSGLDAVRHTLERFERLYWGLGTHLGNGTIQGPQGDWVARGRRCAAKRTSPFRWCRSRDFTPTARSSPSRRFAW